MRRPLGKRNRILAEQAAAKAAAAAKEEPAVNLADSIAEPAEEFKAPSKKKKKKTSKKKPVKDQ